MTGIATPNSMIIHANVTIPKSTVVQIGSNDRSAILNRNGAAFFELSVILSAFSMG